MVHHVKNLKEFTKCVKNINLHVGLDEELRRYDMSALMTSVPVDKALDVIWKRLKNNESLSERTPLAPDNIITLLDKYLNCM